MISVLPFSKIAVLITATTLLLSACVSTEKNEGNQPADRVPLDPHQAMVEKYSAGEADYNGFYNRFEFKATLHNLQIREALIIKMGSYFGWDHSQFAKEREKASQEMASQTEAFVSFFTPDRVNDNLSGHKTIWRVFLDVGGKRFEGKVKKSKKLLAEIQALYPYHTRWNSPYYVTFPVATSVTENSPSTLTITGPLGAKTVNFKPVHDGNN